MSGGRNNKQYNNNNRYNKNHHHNNKNQQQKQEELEQLPHSQYKTTLCKHWEETQECSRGESCHFAHGKDDLRDPEQNSKAKQVKLNSIEFLQNNWNSGQPHNYKSVLCKNFDKGNCKFGENCSFAHGQNELRKPDSQKQNKIQLRAIQKQLQSIIFDYNYNNACLMVHFQQQYKKVLSELHKITSSDFVRKQVQSSSYYNSVGQLQDCRAGIEQVLNIEPTELSDADREFLAKAQKTYKYQIESNKRKDIQLPIMANMSTIIDMTSQFGGLKINPAAMNPVNNFPVMQQQQQLPLGKMPIQQQTQQMVLNQSIKRQ